MNPPEFGEEIALPWLTARRSATELVPLTACAGRICGANAGFYPPANAFLIAGERIAPEKARALASRPAHTFGVEEGKLPVVIEEER